VYPLHLLREFSLGEVELVKRDAVSEHPVTDTRTTVRVEVVALVETGVQAVDVVDVHKKNPPLGMFGWSLLCSIIH
jgi:hypothetical protein